jgi:hypothetical protein
VVAIGVEVDLENTLKLEFFFFVEDGPRPTNGVT